MFPLNIKYSWVHMAAGSTCFLLNIWVTPFPFIRPSISPFSSPELHVLHERLTVSLSRPDYRGKSAEMDLGKCKQNRFSRWNGENVNKSICEQKETVMDCTQLHKSTPQWRTLVLLGCRSVNTVQITFSGINNNPSYTQSVFKHNVLEI